MHINNSTPVTCQN